MIPRKSLIAATAAAAALAATSTGAAAQPADVEPEPVRDGLILGGAAATALLLDLLPIRQHSEPWEHELFGGWDKRVRDYYSPRAGLFSQVGLAASLAVPAGFAIGTDWDREAGERALVYGESLALTLAVGSVSKVIFARPRPYTYNKSAGAVLRSREAGKDAYRSMMSSHAALAFASVAAGGALHSSYSDDKGTRALAYGLGAFSAAATANMRVRAGKHFYSDVVVGALVGTAIGTAVPALQSGSLHVPSGIEWAGIAGGLVLGVAGSQIVPLENKRLGADAEVERGVTLVPLVVKGGAGLGLAGAL